MALMDRLRDEGAPRVAVFGLDGVPYSLIADNPERFEHLTALLERGAGGPLEGLLPPESSATWPAVTTGVNPGETGVFGLLDRDVHSYETYVTTGNDVQAPQLWDRVTAADRSASVINVPMTNPPQRNLQRMVSGFLAPDIERASHPKALAPQFNALDYRIDVDATLGSDGDVTSFLEDAYETVDARFEAFAHVIDQDDWDLFFGVFMTPDRVNHFLYGDYLDNGPYREDLLAFYEQLDTYLGALRNRLPDDVHVAVVSEHGFTRLEYEVNVNAWLAEEGWFHLEAGSEATLDDIGAEARAYALPPGRIYLNLEGREPRGTVPDTEYEVVRNRLREALLDWEAPDGTAVLEAVHPRESLYRGQHVAMGPDLVAEPTPGFDLKAPFDTTGQIFSQSDRTGMHLPRDGTFLLDVPEADLEAASLYDVAPTLLTLLEIEFDRSDLDGSSRVSD